MKRSLQQHLSLMLGAAVLLTSIAAAMASFGLAFLEAKEFQDDMLRQIASLNTRSRQTGGETGAGDAESRIMVLRLPGNARPEWLPENPAPGFHTIVRSPGNLRIFIRDQAPGERVVVAQPTDARDEVAINSALRTLIPLLLLLPVLAWLIVRIVRRELAPIARLSRSLDGQPADRPQPLADQGLPLEITPFVHAINRLLERVNHLIGQQRRFIADAAHELRTPLTALSLQAQNLRQAGSLESAQERALALQAGIERARRLTEQLLSLARTQSGGEAQSMVNVSQLARELIADYLPLAGERGIDLGMDEIAPVTMRTAPETLRLVLKNALENALKHAPEGGTVTLRLRSAASEAVFEIIDNGSGIAAAERERVFEAFYRSPGATDQGSGLGLAIAREAALRLGGTVSLHDRPEGPGLVFRYRQQNAPHQD